MSVSPEDCDGCKKLPAEWAELLGITIMDPDGWDRRNFREDWAKPITQNEFNEKAAMSTIMLHRKE